MCTKILICHGDGPRKVLGSCEAQAFYLTTDKKYAIPVEEVKISDNGDIIIPSNAPKYEIKIINEKLK